MLVIMKLFKKITSLKTHIGWLLADLFVVFIGVYAAGMLADYKDQKRAEDRKQQIEATLLRKFSELDREFAQLESFEETITKSWIEPYKQGEMPKPGNYLDVGGFELNEGLWTAMLTAGGLEALEVELIEAVEDFYEFIRGYQEEARRHLRLFDQSMLPYIEEDISFFYDRETKKLKSKYTWYHIFLTRMIDQVKEAREKVKRILQVLEDKTQK